MRKTRFTTEQIITILQEHAAGAQTPVFRILRESVRMTTDSRHNPNTWLPCR